MGTIIFSKLNDIICEIIVKYRSELLTAQYYLWKLNTSIQTQLKHFVAESHDNFDHIRSAAVRRVVKNKLLYICNPLKKMIHKFLEANIICYYDFATRWTVIWAMHDRRVQLSQKKTSLHQHYNPKVNNQWSTNNESWHKHRMYQIFYVYIQLKNPTWELYWSQITKRGTVDHRSLIILSASLCGACSNAANAWWLPRSRQSKYTL